jgi:hypothetical protein
VEYCKLHKLTPTGPKKLLIKRILDFIDPRHEVEAIPIGGVQHKKKKAKRQPAVRPSISEIKKGLTPVEIHSKWNAEDLVEWCQEKKIKHTGPKKQLIKRIITFLETGEVDEPKQKKQKTK